MNERIIFFQSHQSVIYFLIVAAIFYNTLDFRHGSTQVNMCVIHFPDLYIVYKNN